MNNITCFGEVLWDKFPEHKKIGGAPLNVAVRLKSLGSQVAMISRIGDDTDGQKILAFIKKNGIQTDGIQVDKELLTGSVEVTLDATGSATYEILFPSAWDQIALSPAAQKIVAASEAFVFGSLIARNETSKKTLYALLKIARYKIFDVNLRAPHYNKEILVHLMKEADFIKFNDEEIFEISETVPAGRQVLTTKPPSLEEAIQLIAHQTNTKTICVTKGGDGAILFMDGNFYHNAGYKVKVADTVGAGDSFLASLINKLLNQENPQAAINYACAMGALVASRKGANPVISEEEIAEMMELG